MAASLQSAATLMAMPLHFKSSHSISKAFGFETCAPRLTCSLHPHLKGLAHKCADATKIAGFALASSALLVSGASAEGVPKRLTYDEIQSKTYLEVKGTGTANQCPTIDGGVDSFAFKPGKYNAKKFCLEPTSFTVKAEGVNKNAPPEFQNTKLMTRLTYTLDEIEGPFEVSQDGTVKFEEKDRIDYAAMSSSFPEASACTLHYCTGESRRRISGAIVPRIVKGDNWGKLPTRFQASDMVEGTSHRHAMLCS